MGRMSRSDRRGDILGLRKNFSFSCKLWGTVSSKATCYPAPSLTFTHLRSDLKSGLSAECGVLLRSKTRRHVYRRQPSKFEKLFFQFTYLLVVIITSWFYLPLDFFRILSLFTKLWTKSSSDLWAECGEILQRVENSVAKLVDTFNANKSRQPISVSPAIKSVPIKVDKKLALEFLVKEKGYKLRKLAKNNVKNYYKIHM